MLIAVMGVVACGAAPGGATPTTPPPATTAAGVPTAREAGAPHVMVIVLENREYNEVIGNVAAPYFNSLVQRGGLATDYMAQAHPSLPNYLTLIAGSTFGISSDCTGCTVSGPNLADQLEAAHDTWRAYMESMPSPCYAGAGVNGGYARKHDPFLYFPQIADNPARCANVVPMTGMLSDLNGTNPPDFVFTVPNLCDDGHDCGTPSPDAWLARMMPQLLATRWYAQHGIIIITWDEGTTDAACCAGAHGGHVATLVLSSTTRPASTLATPVDHAGALRTIEAVYGLSYLADAACSCSGSLQPLIG
jgi:phosphatidylinositol-3-phosphatase